MRTSALLLLAVLGSFGAKADDNVLTPAEKAEGWILLFDGKTLDGWTTNTGAASKTPVDTTLGALNPHGCGGYMLIHREMRGDFTLALDFKISPHCNSGVFIRTFPLTPRPGKDVGYNGIEVAIDDTKTAGFTDTGALYDLVRPSENAMKPVGAWNHLVVTCDGPIISVDVNGREVSRANLDAWTVPNRRPDGSPHKFDIAYKNHPRRGYIGLQDHGANCWYKNIKLLPPRPMFQNRGRRTLGDADPPQAAARGGRCRERTQGDERKSVGRSAARPSQALGVDLRARTVAVIGATEKFGSVGRTVFWNLVSNPFGGTVYPVNPKRTTSSACARIPPSAHSPNRSIWQSW